MTPSPLQCFNGDALYETPCMAHRLRRLLELVPPPDELVPHGLRATQPPDQRQHYN